MQHSASVYTDKDVACEYKSILELEDDGEIDHVITQQNSHHYTHQDNHC